MCGYALLCLWPWMLDLDVHMQMDFTNCCSFENFCGMQNASLLAEKACQESSDIASSFPTFHILNFGK